MFILLLLFNDLLLLEEESFIVYDWADLVYIIVMNSEVEVQIVSKLAETVLQLRLETKKTLFRHIQAIFVQVKKEQKEMASLPDFLGHLLPRDSYNLCQKLAPKQKGNKTSAVLSLQIIFTLSQKATGRKINAEEWSFIILKKKDITSTESLGLVTEFFSETVLILNKLPLFSVYQKEKQLKSRYCLDYAIQVEKLKESSLLDLRSQHFLHRQNQQISLSMKVAYLSSLDFLAPKSYFSQFSKRKESTTSSDYAGDKKVSVYAFYDPDLDFTFLSSDEQNFKIKEKGEEIKMDFVESDVSQEFQLLIANEDQDFVEDAKDSLEILEKYSKEYFC